MDDDASGFGTFTQRVIGWLRVSRFLSASMVVYLRFTCRFGLTRCRVRGLSQLATSRVHNRGSDGVSRVLQKIFFKQIRGQCGRKNRLAVLNKITAMRGAPKMF